jgi:hypothetical protein
MAPQQHTWQGKETGQEEKLQHNLDEGYPSKIMSETQIPPATRFTQLATRTTRSKKIMAI